MNEDHTGKGFPSRRDGTTRRQAIRCIVRQKRLAALTGTYLDCATSAVPTHKEFALIPAGLLNRGCAPQDIAKIVGGTL